MFTDFYRFFGLSWETPFSGSSRIRDDTRISGIWMHERMTTTCYNGYEDLFLENRLPQEVAHGNKTLISRIEFSQLSWEVPTENP